MKKPYASVNKPEREYFPGIGAARPNLKACASHRKIKQHFQVTSNNL